MSLRIVTQPSQEPVTLAEAKAHLRLEESHDDSYVTACITAARQYIEKVCWRALLQTTFELSQGSFRGEDKEESLPEWATLAPSFPQSFSQPSTLSPTGRFQPFIELPRGHLADTPAVSVVYFDESNAQQTLATAAYQVQSRGEDCGRVWLNAAAGYSWPTVYSRPDAVRVTYTVGWSTPANVPGPLKQAVLLLVSQMYEYRTPEITGTIATTLQFTIDALTSPYRLLRL